MQLIYPIEACPVNLAKRCLIHASKMDGEGWYVTANVLAQASERLEQLEANGAKMSPAVYRKRLEALGLTQERAAELMGYSGRTGQTWAADGPPQVVAMVLLAIGKDLEALEALSRRARDTNDTK